MNKKIQNQKGSVTTAVIMIVVVVIVAAVIYLAVKNKPVIITDVTPISTSTTTAFASDLRTYTNSVYGFTFQYPADWVFSQPKDKISFTVSAPMTLTSGNNPSPVYSITFTPIQVSTFGRVETKIGSIVYDQNKMALYDVSSNPPRCLPVLDQSLTVPSIGYGGSLMSTPAHFESAILTNKSYMILVQELEDTPSATIDQIRSSFKFINGVQARVPNCTSSTDSSPSDSPVPVITSILPSSGPVGTTIELKGSNLAGFEGDLNAWIENSKGEVAFLPGIGNVPRADQTIRVKIDSQLCKQDNSYKGGPCTSYLTVTPGIYSIYTLPWDKMSNKVQLTITN